MMRNEKLVQALKCGDDLGAVAEALENGSITERQAKSLVTFIARGEGIRKQPIQTAVVEDEKGQIVGEVNPLPDGSWNAQRYGPGYQRGGGTVFDTLEEAKRFVLSGDSGL